MNPPSRPPVVSPALLRDLRQTWLPYVVFLGVLVFAASLWRTRAGKIAMVGQAEAVRTIAAATQAGVVATVQVDLLQRVKQGDVLAQVIPANLEAEAAKLAAGVEALRAELLQAGGRGLVDYQQLRLDWLRRQVDLATARVELQVAQGEFLRYENLRQNQIISAAEFELRRGQRDALQSKVDALLRLSSDLEATIARLAPSADAADQPADRAIAAAVVAQQKQLEALAAAGQVKAPMDGVVATVAKRSGEGVQPGEPVVVLGALQPRRIVAYLRQPIERPLRPGDLVDITSRGTRRTARAHVLQVGAQLEAIDPSLLPVSPSLARVTEYGLPLLVEIPAGLQLAPGEIVNLSVAAGS